METIYNSSSISEYIYSSFSTYFGSNTLQDLYRNDTSVLSTGPLHLVSSKLDGSFISHGYEELFHDISETLGNNNYQKWIFTILGCILVGLSGVFPIFLIQKTGPTSDRSKNYSKEQVTLDPNKSGIGTQNLKCLLSFAVGSLLGDVFLHLLPEAWSNVLATGATTKHALHLLGFWILAGIVSFFICERLITYEDEDSDEPLDSSVNNNVTKNMKISQDQILAAKTENSSKCVAGYLNLVANSFDNFTHGLAVAGSFISSPRIGLLTTIAILLHEIPHEIGDFAILLRSGFNPWSAAKAQLSTATIGLLGAILTLSVDCIKTIGNLTWWILPFTSGCFINIALSNLLPELMSEKDPKESLKHLACVLIGIGVMGFVTIMFE